MKPIHDWLSKNHDGCVRDLAELVAIQSVSTDGEHQKEVEQSAALTCEHMRRAGLQHVEILRCGGSNPYAYGEWLGAPGKPTVFLYAHHDVQPVQQDDLDKGRWLSPPWELTSRGGRLYARGSADDKGAITAQLAAVGAFLKTRGRLPVNVKVLVEGEEEVGSSNLMSFFKQYRQLIHSDVIVVCDTENIETGLPSITYSLRGIVALMVEVESAKGPVHSGMAGGALADSAIALNVILSRLFWKNGKLPVPGMYDGVRKTTPAERRTFNTIPYDEPKLRKDTGILAGVALATEKGTSVYEQTWRKPAVTIIAQEASSIKQASNQVLPRASAIVSCRIVPDQDPDQVYEALKTALTRRPALGRQGDGQDDGQAGEVVDDRPDRPGLRGGDVGHEGRLQEGAGRHRLRRHHRLRRPSRRFARRRPGPAPGHRGPAQQRPRPQRKPAPGGLVQADGLVGSPVREPRQSAGRQGEMTRQAMADEERPWEQVGVKWAQHVVRPPDVCTTKLLPGFKLNCAAVFQAARRLGANSRPRLAGHDRGLRR